MVFFVRYFIIFSFFALILGCETKKSYNIGSDKAVADMTTQITSLTEDLNTLNSELDEVKKVLKDPDIDAELRQSIRQEIHEGDKHLKSLEQIIAYLKIRRKKRYNSLLARKGSKNLKEQAEKEIKAYFVDKKLNPLERPWKDRYRTAIEL